MQRDLRRNGCEKDRKMRKEDAEICSQTGIDLVGDVVACESGPIAACLGHDARDVHAVDDVIGALEDVDVETGAHVPCNVAVEWPDARVVEVDLDDHVGRGAVRLCRPQELDIAALWVASSLDAPAIGTIALIEYVHVVTVHVHWVADGHVVVEDQTHAPVGSEVVNVPLRVELAVAQLGLEQNGVIVVAAEGALVHEPHVFSRVGVGCVRTEGNVDGLGRRWVRGSHGVNRNGLGQLVILAFS